MEEILKDIKKGVNVFLFVSKLPQPMRSLVEMALSETNVDPSHLIKHPHSVFVDFFNWNTLSHIVPSNVWDSMYHKMAFENVDPLKVINEANDTIISLGVKKEVTYRI